MPIPKVAAQAKQIIFIGKEGSDAGGIRIVSDGHGGWKIEKVPGWNPEEMVEVGNALQVASRAAALKTPRISQAIINSAMEHANEGLKGGGIENATIIVIGG